MVDIALPAIVMAGDKGASRSVMGQNKTLLDMHGRPVFMHVLSALDQAELVSRIILIGPKDKLSRYTADWQHTKPLLLLDQKDNIIENGWMGFLHSLPDYTEDTPEDVYKNKYPEAAVMIATGDIPLLVPAEADHFIRSADLDANDFIYGITTEETMKKFYPRRNTPGIKMAYFYMKEFPARHSNFIIVKPFHIARLAYIRKMYGMRYQKSLFNMLKVVWALFTAEGGSSKILWDYFVLQFNMQLARLGLEPLTRLTRRLTSLQSLLNGFSALLGTRFAAVQNPLGGAALDMDNDKDYLAMFTMFEAWKKEQRELGKKLG